LTLDSDDTRAKISSVFSVIHLSAQDFSDKMLQQLKRHNYITPTHFLELSKGYRVILTEKRTELGNGRDKLANGLAKLVEARDGVEVMSVELEKKKVVCAQSQKDCENLLVEIVSERRVADEQRKQVEGDSERIGKEEIECKAIADDAEAELNVALPALQKAMAEVEKLDKSAISEIKAYKSPPKQVETVLAAVMILFGNKTDWTTAKKVLGEANFLQSIKGYDKDNVSATIMKKIKGYVSHADFKPEAVGAVSKAAGALCTWVHAIYIYASVAKEVAPKRARLKGAQESLAVKQASLQKAQEELAEVTAKVNRLKQKYDDSVGEKNRLRAEADQMELLLDRADKLVKGLAGENERWRASIGQLQNEIGRSLGDALVAAAFLSYAGPFDTQYRSNLVGGWLSAVREQQLPSTENFTFASFCALPTDVRQWNIQGLPADNFSTENGAISVRCSRWPLMIDPQNQANKWVRKMEESQLHIVDLKSKDMLRKIENGIVYGLPVLLQDVLEELDPALEPVLAKALIKVGNREVLRLGDKELDYNKDFKLYITTKLANPFRLSVKAKFKFPPAL
jgi:dynein heavy chain